MSLYNKTRILYNIDNRYSPVRRYREHGQRAKNEISQRHLICLMQEELRKNNFMDFDKLKMAFKENDQDAAGALTQTVVRRILISSLALTRSRSMANSFRHLLDLYLDKTEVKSIDIFFE